jgi:hypothetical protein
MLELHPVNREGQVAEFVKACAENQKIANGNGDRKALKFPVCAQMFGSGKTTFGQIVSNIGAIDSLSTHCEKLGDSVAPVLDKLKHSLLVRVDCCDLPPNWSFIRDQYKVHLQDPSVSAVLQFLILTTLERSSQYSEHLVQPQTLPRAEDVFKTDHVSCAKFVKLVRDAFGSKPIILHFDEVSVFERPDFSDICKLQVPDDPKHSAPDDIEKRRAIFAHYQVWDYLAEFMLEEDVFMLYTGRSLAVGLIGCRLDCQCHGMDSPTQVCQIILPPLKAEHLTTIVSNTLLDGVTYQSKVFSNGDLVKTFVEHCLRVTSGIPRLIESVLEFLQLSRVASEAQIDSIFKSGSPEYAAIRDSRGLSDCFKVDDMGQPWKTMINSMLTFALLGIPITMTAAGPNGKSYAEIVQRLGLYIAPVKDAPNQYVLLLPEVVRDLVLKQSSDYLLPHVVDLLKSPNVEKG